MVDLADGDPSCRQLALDRECVRSAYLQAFRTVGRWTVTTTQRTLAILILGCLSIIARHAPLGLSNGWLFGLILLLLPDAIMRWSLSNDGFPAGIFE